MQQSGAIHTAGSLTTRDFELVRAQSIVKRAQGVEANFQKFAKIIANKLGARKEDIEFGPIKSPGDILCKAERKFSGNINAVKDVLRATITIHRPEQVEKAQKLLEMMQDGKLSCINGVKPFNIKNTFKNSSYKGYKTLKANFSFPEFDATEIQLCLPADAKEKERSHEAYQVERACIHAFITLFAMSSGAQSGKTSPQQLAEISRKIGKKQRKASMARERHNELAFT